MAQVYFINVITSNILNFFYLQFRKYGTKRILNRNDKYSTLEVQGALYGHLGCYIFKYLPLHK